MYWMALFDQRTHTWHDKAFRTLQECRVAGYKNVTTTDAYKIPIRASKTGKKVIGEVYLLNGPTVKYSSYDGRYLTIYVIDSKGKLYNRVIRKPHSGFLEYEF